MTGSAPASVVLMDFPLRVAGRAYRHREALLREFAIIAAGGGEQADVPKRLVEIATLLDDRYGGLNPEADALVDAAVERDDEYVDLHLAVLPQLREDTLDIAALLLEADEYCRTGGLLTLSPTEEMRDFWRWFLGEFVRQAEGDEPRSWLAFSGRR